MPVVLPVQWLPSQSTSQVTLRVLELLLAEVIIRSIHQMKRPFFLLLVLVVVVVLVLLLALAQALAMVVTVTLTLAQQWKVARVALLLMLNNETRMPVTSSVTCFHMVMSHVDRVTSSRSRKNHLQILVTCNLNFVLAVRKSTRLHSPPPTKSKSTLTSTSITPTATHPTRPFLALAPCLIQFQMIPLTTNWIVIELLHRVNYTPPPLPPQHPSTNLTRIPPPQLLLTTMLMMMMKHPPNLLLPNVPPRHKLLNHMCLRLLLMKLLLTTLAVWHLPHRLRKH